MRARPYTTLDGSQITELVRPDTDGSQNLSVAEAQVAPGTSTLAHRHGASEEVYYVLSGRGMLTVGARHVELAPGEAHLIRPGEEHWVTCTGAEPLRILCLCAPPYEHEDTRLSGGVVT